MITECSDTIINGLFFCPTSTKGNMGWSDSSMDGVCWILAIVVIGVLIYLGCCELRKSPPPAVPPRRGTTGTTSARAAVHKKDDDEEHGNHNSGKLPEPRRELKGVPLADAFQEFDIDRSLTRTVPEDAYQVPDSVFMQEFVDGDKSTFRPVNKEAALKSANTRPSQHMKNGRADAAPPSRVIGLSPMEFARKTVQRPVSAASCVSFNDTDSRQVMVNESTNCFETESCPWQ